MTTAGERSGRDYGHDYQEYSSRYLDADGYGAWEPEPSGYPAGDYPSAGYRPVDQPTEAYPPRHGGYPAAGYPANGYTGNGYAHDAYTRDSYRRDPAGGYPPDGYPRDPVGGSPADGYPRGAARARPRQAAGVNGRPRPDSAYTRGAVAGHGQKKRRGLPLWQEIPLLLIIAFCLAVLVRTFLMQAFFIPSGSMEDTLIAGDRVLVNKVVYNFREPARGEVVVFKGTDAWAPEVSDDGDIGTFAKAGRTFGDLIGISQPGEKDFIKRVVGVPGDTISCCDVNGRVFVNGQPIDEDYVIRDSPLEDGQSGAQDCRSRRFDEVVVQPGQLFVMGDHRQVSQDSRCQGQVPIDNVIGRAFLIVWPSGRWDGLSTPETFAAVPGPAAMAAQPAVPPESSVPAQLAVALPILLPVGWTFRRNSARSRLTGRRPGRRLAE